MRASHTVIKHRHTEKGNMTRTFLQVFDEIPGHKVGQTGLPDRGFMPVACSCGESLQNATSPDAGKMVAAEHFEKVRQILDTPVLKPPGIISPDVAEWVLYWKTKGRRGLNPGSFVDSLLEAISLADRENTEKLRLGFPEFVEASHTSTDDLVWITERG
jgi:hypothetical protein